MKKLLTIFSLLLTVILQAQTPSLPITTVNNLKITNPVQGEKSDSILVWRGSGDKVARYLPYSGIINNLQEVTQKGNTTSNRIYFTDGTIDLSTIDQTSVPTVLSTKPNVLLANSFTDSDLVANHGFSDINRINKSINNWAYNSFDALTEFTGSSNYDHYAGFQARPRYGSTGTINYIRGYAVEPRVTSGTVSLLDGLTIYDYTGTGGTVSQYAGVRVKSLSKAGINWALYTEGTTPSRLEGNLDLSTTAGVADVVQSVLRFNSGANHTPMATIHNQFASTSSGSLHFKVRNTSVSGDSGLVEVMKINGGAVRSVDITGKATVSLAPTSNTDVVRKLELDLKANIASPTFTGVPAAPTAAVGTNTTQLATTQFVKSEIANIKSNVLAKTTTYTITMSDFGSNGFLDLYVDATAGAVTINYPAAATMKGYTVTVTKTDASANSVTLDASGSELINGSATYILTTQFMGATLGSNSAGTQLYIKN